VGRLISILQISEDRVQPFCPVFNACGGCTLQHLSYAGQLKYKSRYVQQCMARIGGIDIELPAIEPCENIRGYRNKASFPVAGEPGHARAGFFAPRSHKLVECDCPIQQPEINEVKKAVIRWANQCRIPPYNETEHSGVLRHIVARQSSAGGVMAGVVVRNEIDGKTLVDALQEVPGIESVVVNVNPARGNVILGDDTRTVFGRDYITEEYGGLMFRASLQSFLQVNHAQTEKLYRIALDYAGITQEDVVFDLFCGIGTLSLLAVRRARNVLGIEYEASAMRNAEENARLNGIANAQFLAGDAGEMLKKGIDTAGVPDIVILDPPRKGCDAALIEGIAAASPKRVVYVSCNPATLARDAALFVKQGYKVERLRCVDMFPHTTHVESVVLMSRL